MLKVDIKYLLDNIDSLRVLDMEWFDFAEPVGEENFKQIPLVDKEHFFADEEVDVNQLEYFYIVIDTLALYDDPNKSNGDEDYWDFISEELDEYGGTESWFFYLLFKELAPKVLTKVGDDYALAYRDGWLVIKGCQLLRNLKEEDYDSKLVDEIIPNILYPKDWESYKSAWIYIDNNKEDVFEYSFGD